MEKVRLPLFFLGLVLAASITLSCGSGTNSNRSLQSVTLSPATADAQDYDNGPVQFVATGHYSVSPRTATPLSAFWGTCYQNATTTAITVTSEGLAKCASGAVGIYTVWAENPPLPNAMCDATTACGGGCFVVGSAQLTCP
jgi:hypothetical protein